jgi:hypothetical protein
MRVLAASFPDDASARAAKDQLIGALGLEPSEIGVEALAHERNVNDVAILAGRFQEDAVSGARQVVERLGGTLVIDIDDRGQNA